jgi:hypothetical protein
LTNSITPIYGGVNFRYTCFSKVTSHCCKLDAEKLRT